MSSCRVSCRALVVTGMGAKIKAKNVVFDVMGLLYCNLSLLCAGFLVRMTPNMGALSSCGVPPIDRVCSSTVFFLLFLLFSLPR